MRIVLTSLSVLLLLIYSGCGCAEEVEIIDLTTELSTISTGNVWSILERTTNNNAVTVDCARAGIAPPAQCIIEYYYHPDTNRISGWELIDRTPFTTPSLAENESRAMISFPTPNPGLYGLRMELNVNREVQETDYSNNVMLITHIKR